MALIICTECGKKYSDKAVSCPSCGCPTEVSTNPENSAKAQKQAEQVRRSATAKLLDECKKARERAKQAEDLFDRRSDRVQRMASQNVNIFSGDATSRVIEIRSAARQACENLYATYQSLIPALDAICRPLLTANPEGKAIKEVADVIRYLNEESEIEDNFDASFNGASLGRMASTKYAPSIDNQMIQKFWETEYASSPDAKLQAEKKKAAEAERRRKEQEQHKRAEEQRKIDAEKKRQDEKLAVERKDHMDRVHRECREKLAVYMDAVKKEVDRKQSEVRTQLTEYIFKLQSERDQAAKQISSMGFFQLKAKTGKKREIEIIDNRINKLSSADALNAELNRIKATGEDAIKRYSFAIEQYLSSRFPYSNSRKTGSSKYEEDSAYVKKPYPEPPDVSTLFQNNESD